MASTSVHSRYPWAQLPLIVGAPMGLFIATPSFAVAVTRAGGLGFLAAGAERETMLKGLETAESLLTEANVPSVDGMLPVGIGSLLFSSTMDALADAVQTYHPIAVWLFGAVKLSDYASWAQRIREVSPKTHVWVQTGTVTDAVEIAQSTRPDVLVCQGGDAGGHGLEKAPSIISLVPEIADALEAKGYGQIPLVAAGGIANGRSVAASVALGAVGVAMGTRFLAAKEIELPIKGYEHAILVAKDGGPATIRDKIFDDLNPRGNIWPVDYDGRAIRNLSWEDKYAGKSTEEIFKLQGQAAKEGDKASNGPDSRITLWAGTGVGFVTRVQSSAEIVEEVRAETRKVMEKIKSSL